MQIAMSMTSAYPARCVVRAVIRLLTGKVFPNARIHREFCLLYGHTVMSDGRVRLWCLGFKYDFRIVHDEERSGRL